MVTENMYRLYEWKHYYDRKCAVSISGVCEKQRYDGVSIGKKRFVMDMKHNFEFRGVLHTCRHHHNFERLTQPGITTQPELRCIDNSVQESLFSLIYARFAPELDLTIAHI